MEERNSVTPWSGSRFEDQLDFREDWMPPVGLYNFVIDVLVNYLGVELQDKEGNLQVPNEWIIISIMSELDFIHLAGWWVWKYSGLLNSNLPYEAKITWHDKETKTNFTFPPNRVLAFQRDPSKNQFHYRLENDPKGWPDTTLLDDKEIAESIPFLESYFQSFDVKQPPQAISEAVIWATKMWILWEEGGQEWLADQDKLFWCIEKYDSAFQAIGYSEDREILDPEYVYVEDRSVMECEGCGVTAWCVVWESYPTEAGRACGAICHHCIRQIQKLDHKCLNQVTLCPGEGLNSSPRATAEPICMNTSCPYVSDNIVEETYEAAGHRRVERYWKSIEDNGGVNPRLAAGQTLPLLESYFTIDGYEIPVTEVRFLPDFDD